jgi:hypothetical protein
MLHEVDDRASKGTNSFAGFMMEQFIQTDKLQSLYKLPEEECSLINGKVFNQKLLPSTITTILLCKQLT